MTAVMIDGNVLLDLMTGEKLGGEAPHRVGEAGGRLATNAPFSSFPRKRE
jgi:hypothetical protein